jgi:hypothetical protein
VFVWECDRAFSRYRFGNAIALFVGLVGKCDSEALTCQFAVLVCIGLEVRSLRDVSCSRFGRCRFKSAIAV